MQKYNFQYLLVNKADALDLDLPQLFSAKTQMMASTVINMRKGVVTMVGQKLRLHNKHYI